MLAMYGILRIGKGWWYWWWVINNVTLGTNAFSGHFHCKHDEMGTKLCKDQDQTMLPPNSMLVLIQISKYIKFKFSKNATKFEIISHMIWCLLSKCQIKWDIVLYICGLFRMSKLYRHYLFPSWNKEIKIRELKWFVFSTQRKNVEISFKVQI